MSLLSQLVILEAATSRLEAVLAARQHCGADDNGQNLLSQLHQSLAACANSIELLANHVGSAKTALDAGLMIGRRTRAREAKEEQSTALLDAENSNMLHRVADRSSSLMCLRDSASVASFTDRVTDSISRASIIFGFDTQLLDTKLYRGAVITAWRKLHRPPRNDYQPSNNEHEAHDSDPTPHDLDSIPHDHDDQIAGRATIRGPERSLTLLVKWNFRAEHPNELSCAAGDVIVPIRIAGNDWVLARPAAGSSPPGIVPIGYLSVPSMNGSECTSVEEAREALLKLIRIQVTSPGSQDQTELSTVNSPKLDRMPPDPQASESPPRNTTNTSNSPGVAMDDPCSKVLSFALRKYGIEASPDDNINGLIAVVVVSDGSSLCAVACDFQQRLKEEHVMTSIPDSLVHHPFVANGGRLGREVCVGGIQLPATSRRARGDAVWGNRFGE
ncbi:hypothetical protein PG985_000238 [Apiospora marii]|uniref:uncharacterized protein n=1 Tax=Apiospora marii TaxID=335849 RepID=UPI00312E348F